VRVENCVRGSWKKNTLKGTLGQTEVCVGLKIPHAQIAKLAVNFHLLFFRFWAL
jgi:hypothetical protein